MKAYSFTVDSFSTNQVPTSSQSAGEVIQFQSTRRATVNLSQAAWINNIIARLSELCALPRGWDGYSGEPVSYELARYAEEILNVMGECFCEKVNITPCSGGEILLEWHLLGGDVELQLLKGGTVDAYLSNVITKEEKERVYIDNFSEVYNWLEMIHGENYENCRSAIH